MSVESGFKISQKMMARMMPYEINQVKNEEELEEESGFVDEDGLDAMTITDTEEATEVAKLSGIQITSANAIIAKVATGELTREAAKNQLMTFLGLTSEQADKVMVGVKVGQKLDA